MDQVRRYLALRFGKLELQANVFTHVGMELAQTGDFSITVTQKASADELQVLPKTSVFWNSRKRPLGSEKVSSCPRKFGELCWLATAPRPDICARLATIAAKDSGNQGTHIYRINDLIRTAKGWQDQVMLKYSLKWRMSYTKCV